MELIWCCWIWDGPNRHTHKNTWNYYYQYLENLQHRPLKKIELLLYRFSSIVASISLRILEQARVTWHISHFYLRRLFNLFLSFLSWNYVIDIDNFIFDVHYKWRKSTMFLLCKDFRLMNFCTVPHMCLQRSPIFLLLWK